MSSLDMDLSPIVDKISNSIVEAIIADILRKLPLRLEEALSKINVITPNITSTSDSELSSATVVDTSGGVTIVSKEANPNISPLHGRLSNGKLPITPVVLEGENEEELTVLWEAETDAFYKLVRSKDAKTMANINKSLATQTPHMLKAIEALTSRAKMHVYSLAANTFVSLDASTIKSILLGGRDMVDGSGMFEGEDNREHYERVCNIMDNISNTLNKSIIKFERVDIANANRVKKLADAKIKAAETVKLKQIAENAKLAKKQELEAAQEDISKPIDIPHILKKNRLKIGVVGLIPANANFIKKEFENTFDISIALTEDGCDKIRAVGANNPIVFLMTKWVSHKHTDLVSNSEIRTIRGGISSLRDALSDYAQVQYNT